MLVLSDIQWFLSVPVLEQIEELLVVDLQKRAVHSVVIWTRIRVASLHLSVVLLLKFAENILNGARNDPQLALIVEEAIDIPIEPQATQRVLPSVGIVVPMLPKHRVGLARTRLPICKDS